MCGTTQDTWLKGLHPNPKVIKDIASRIIQCFHFMCIIHTSVDIYIYIDSSPHLTYLLYRTVYACLLCSVTYSLLSCEHCHLAGAVQLNTWLLSCTWSWWRHVNKVTLPTDTLADVWTWAAETENTCIHGFDIEILQTLWSPNYLDVERQHLNAAYTVMHQWSLSSSVIFEYVWYWHLCACVTFQCLYL